MSYFMRTVPKQVHNFSNQKISRLLEDVKCSQHETALSNTLHTSLYLKLFFPSLNNNISPGYSKEPPQ